MKPYQQLFKEGSSSYSRVIDALIALSKGKVNIFIKQGRGVIKARRAVIRLRSESQSIILEMYNGNETRFQALDMIENEEITDDSVVFDVRAQGLNDWSNIRIERT